MSAAVPEADHLQIGERWEVREEMRDDRRDLRHETERGLWRD